MDVRELRGSCIRRPGGKAPIADKLVHLFPNAELYVEPFFGAGSVFFGLPDGRYPRMAINDLDKQMYTFFKVLRDRTDELVGKCELTPYSRDQFIACLQHSDDELEEARRVWVRSRQGFAGVATAAGNWGRSDQKTWNPGSAEAKLKAMRSYAAKLRPVAIDNIDCIDFIEKWAFKDTFIYCDPPYVASARKCETYEHEMDDSHHRRLSEVLHYAVGEGASVGISGYANDLYDKELYADWRRVEFDIPFSGSRLKTAVDRRTEVYWCSYPESAEARNSYKRSPKASSKNEERLVKALRRTGVIG